MEGKPHIETERLKRYVDLNRAYSLSISNHSVALRFSPDSPEAMMHFPNGEPVEHIMEGVEEDGKIFFTRFITRSSLGETVTVLDGEDDPVMLWLQFID